MFDLTLQMLITRIFAALPIVGLCGFCLAFSARLLGDVVPRQEGRLTLNPFRHLDMIGLLAFILVGFGWIRPMTLTLQRMRGGPFAALLLVVGALVPVVILAAIAVALLPWAATAFSYSTAPLAGSFLAVLARLAIGFFLLNLIPLPPFLLGHSLASLRAGWAIGATRGHWIAGIVAIAIGIAVSPWIHRMVSAVLKFFFGSIPMLSLG